MNHLILSIIAFILTAGSEIAFHTLNNNPSLLPLEKYIGLFIALLLFTFIKSKPIRFIFLALILILSFFQMSHIQFYGMPVYPSAIYLMFTEIGEVTGTLKEELSVFLTPFLLIFPSLILLYTANLKLKMKKSIPYLAVVFAIYLAYNPLRTYMTGNTWGRQPSTQELMGMNIYLSSSYFLGRILPSKLGQTNTNLGSHNYKFTKKESFEGNIIFIIGESLSANHLSLLGYKRETTPYLNTLKESSTFFATKAISAGVSTDVSVAFIINNTYGLQGQNEVIKGHKCLFKFAKESQFKTYFHSSQSQQQLRYISNSLCLTQIDDYKNLNDLDPTNKDPNAASDLILLTNLEKNLASSKKNFYVLHQRGSHGPYNLRYTKEHAKYPMTGKYKTDRINHYDNSVHEFDNFMSKLIAIVETQTTPTIVIYISDHGEGLGEQGVWGHASLKKPSFSIPLITYFHNTPNTAQFSAEPTHLEVTSFISSLLGYKNDLEFPIKNYVILGNDLDGFSGFLNLGFDQDGKLIHSVRGDI